jgi:hypothetical protein
MTMTKSQKMLEAEYCPASFLLFPKNPHPCRLVDSQNSLKRLEAFSTSSLRSAEAK